MKSTTSSKKKRSKTHYAQMTRKELVNRLTARGLPPHYVGAIADRVEAKRKALYGDKRVKTAFRNAWREVITPLQKEQSAISTRLVAMRKKAAQGNVREQTKLAVYEPYASVLSKCLGLLRTYQKAGTRYPIEEYAFRNNLSVDKQAGHDVPLGKSWVDWVPLHIRKALMTEHNQIQNPSARAMRPLFRRDEDVKRGFMKQHAKVVAAWQEEMNKLRDAVDHAPEGTRDYEERQLLCMGIAMEKARKVPPIRNLHGSWRRYITSKEMEVVFREAHPSWQGRVSSLAADETPVDWE
jgi:hypothetical protein